MALFESLDDIKKDRKKLRRRQFLAVATAGVFGYFAYRWYRSQPQELRPRLHTFVTPTRDFYNVSINPAFRPAVTAENYRLLIQGPGNARISLSLSDLRQLETRRIHRTLVCVGNSVGGGAVGNAEWTATPLAPLVERVIQGTRGELKVGFYGLDGFYSSVPLEAALDPQTVLAYEMNGEPLPGRHGYPLRVLIPGRYGMKQPRWLEKVEVTADDPGGYWESRGWCERCLIQATARIDRIDPVRQGGFLVKGMAFCGATPVGSVEWTSDEGLSWQEAELQQEPAAHAWTLWQASWQPAPGDYVLAARVIDARGRLQIEEYDGAFPSGATGLHRVRFRV